MRRDLYQKGGTPILAFSRSGRSLLTQPSHPGYPPTRYLVCSMIHTNFVGAVVLHLGPQRHLLVYNNLIGPQRKGLYHWNGETLPGGCMGAS